MSSIFSSAEIASIVSEVRSVISDDTISTSIDYYKYSGVSAESMWFPQTARLPAMYTISSVSAFKGGYTPQEVMESGGLISRSDTKFIIMSDSVSGVLTVNDKVVEASSIYQSATTYEVKSVMRDPLAICYFIQARAV